MHLEMKNAPALPITTPADATGSFEGYLAVFGNLDHNGDVIEPGAFTKTLADAKAVQQRNRSPFLYPLLWQHDDSEPIGGITDAHEDRHGLSITGQYDLNTDLGKRAYSGAKMGYLPGLSIGFRTIKAVRGSDGVRHLTEIQLFEGSVVTLPANASAMVTSVKARSMHTAARLDSADALARQLVYEAAVTILETKAAQLRRHLDDATLKAQAMERWERWQSDLSALRQRHDMEQKAHARGERVPSLFSDPEAYAAWLQRQRALPYVELARDLNERSRRGLN